MKNHTKIQLLPVVTILALTACSSVEDITYNYPHVSNLANTECLNSYTDNFVIDRDSSHGTFEMTLKGTTAICKFTSLYYPCDYGKVNIKVSYDEGILKIIEYPSYDYADCLCETDATFIVENIPYNDFILKLYHGDTNGEFDDNNPKYTGKITFINGSLSTPY